MRPERQTKDAVRESLECCCSNSLGSYHDVEALCFLLIGPTLGQGLLPSCIRACRLERLCRLTTLKGIKRLWLLSCQQVQQALQGCLQSLVHLQKETENHILRDSGKESTELIVAIYKKSQLIAQIH